MKQFPAYIMQLLPVPLAALAKLPIPEADLTNQTPDLPLAVLDSLSGAMREAASSSISADGKAEDASAAGMSRCPPPNLVIFQIMCIYVYICLHPVFIVLQHGNMQYCAHKLCNQYCSLLLKITKTRLKYCKVRVSCDTALHTDALGPSNLSCSHNLSSVCWPAKTRSQLDTRILITYAVIVLKQQLHTCYNSFMT